MEKKRRCLVLLCVSVLLITACAGIPSKIEKPQYKLWHYTYTILYDPQQPADSPGLDIGLSLTRMMYPAEEINFFNNVLYFGDDPDAYRDGVLRIQRENYRQKLAVPAEGGPAIPPAGSEDEPPEFPEWWSYESSHWLYRETVTVTNTEYRGIMAERVINTYSGGAHGFVTKRYYMIDLDSQRLVKIDDIFQDFQGDATRAVIYDALRNYSGLSAGQPLSEGIYFNDEPELSFNFFLTPEGLGLHWDPYEIAPYSEGGINLVVPWRNIRPLLLHSGMELLVKFNIHLFVG